MLNADAFREDWKFCEGKAVSCLFGQAGVEARGNRNRSVLVGDGSRLDRSRWGWWGTSASQLAARSQFTVKDLACSQAI